MGQQPMRMFVISQSVSSPHPRLPLHRLEVRLRRLRKPGWAVNNNIQHAIMWLMPSSHITHQLITLQTHPVYCSHEHVDTWMLVTCEIGLHGSGDYENSASASATVSRRPLGTGCAGLLSADEYPAPRAGRQGASQGVVVWRATGSAKIRYALGSAVPRSLLRTAS